MTNKVGQVVQMYDDTTGYPSFVNPTNGSEGGYIKLTAALTPAAATANTTGEQTFTVTGVKVGDVVFVNKPTAQAGLGIVGCRVSAANTVGITFSNNTASPITPTAGETYTFGVIR